MLTEEMNETISVLAQPLRVYLRMKNDLATFLFNMHIEPEVKIRAKNVPSTFTLISIHY